MANPPKTERNKLIVRLRRDGMGFKRIGNIFELDFTTVREICNREINRAVDNPAEKPLDEK